MSNISMNNSVGVLLTHALQLSLNVTRHEFTNQTKLTTISPINIIRASLTTVSAVLTLFSNGLILACFIKRPSLRTPFNCYVINLAILDVLSGLVSMPTNVVKEITGQFPLNGLICSVILFINQNVNSGNRAAHLLIATNRLWAVTFPLSYRVHHTKRLAVGVVLFAWSLTLCIVTPRVIITRRKINYSFWAIDPRCEFDNSYPAFQMAVNVFAFNAPEVAILIMYPWLVWKLHRTIRNKVVVIPAIADRRATQTSQDISATLSSKPQMSRMSSNTIAGLLAVPGAEERVVTADYKTESPKLVVSSRQSRASHHADLEDGQIKPAKLQKRASKSKGHNRLFAYLVMSVLICWTPNHVFYLWASITGLWNVPVFTIQSFLLAANSWLNPILIYLADSEIRRAVHELLRCG